MTLRRAGRMLLRALKLQVERDLRARETRKDPVEAAERAYARWNGLSYAQWKALPASVRNFRRGRYFQEHRP